MDQAAKNPYPLNNTQVPDWETPGRPKKPHGFSFKSVLALKSGIGGLSQSSTPRDAVGNKRIQSANPEHQGGGLQSAPQSTSNPEKVGNGKPKSRQSRAWRSSPYLRNRKFLITGATIFLVILALAIGLGVGLGEKKSHRFLPLPSDSQTFTGDLTYYGPGLGACGVTSSNSDHIVSVSHFLFDDQSRSSNPNENPLCGRKIRAYMFDEAVKGNRSIDLTVVDRCTGCQPTDLDVSPGAFNQLADPALGRVTVTWAWLP